MSRKNLIFGASQEKWRKAIAIAAPDSNPILLTPTFLNGKNRQGKQNYICAECSRIQSRPSRTGF
ncbi:hypothetical protein [Spirulina sp. 06S082]|uniref:hypothetical protein n=1 Tax=Spirulina sp. 06S082 TaxID=3110248 RepID=UPI002B2156B4|nr:hypothetical protein [Spirulina sp. 06S082]MEA5471834.1 hypothetical protein [Spirulina sp. 06S082]